MLLYFRERFAKLFKGGPKIGEESVFKSGFKSQEKEVS